MPFVATWMQLEIITLSEVSQERERQIPNDITCVENLKYGINKPIYKTETENTLVVAKGEGGGRGMDWEFGVSRCKL